MRDGCNCVDLKTYAFCLKKKKTKTTNGATQYISVIGVEMEQLQIQSIFDEVTGSGAADHVNCKSTDSLFCYLLNDGGVVMASNQQHVKVSTDLLKK